MLHTNVNLSVLIPFCPGYQTVVNLINVTAIRCGVRCKARYIQCDSIDEDCDLPVTSLDQPVGGDSGNVPLKVPRCSLPETAQIEFL